MVVHCLPKFHFVQTQPPKLERVLTHIRMMQRLSWSLRNAGRISEISNGPLLASEDSLLSRSCRHLFWRSGVDRTPPVESFSWRGELNARANYMGTVPKLLLFFSKLQNVRYMLLYENIELWARLTRLFTDVAWGSVTEKLTWTKIISIFSISKNSWNRILNN